MAKTIPKTPALNAHLPASALHSEAFSVEQKGHYLHWEELRHRPAPGTLSHADWWQLVKLARVGLRRDLPLRDEQGGTFGFGMTDSVQRLVHEVDREASGRIELPEDVTSPAVRDRYIVSSLIEESFRSSQLEGASTTQRVAKDMIRTKREPRTVSERMILNNFYGMEWVRRHRDEDLSVPLILQLHEIMTRDTLDVADAGGRFRRADEEVHVVDEKGGEILHTPPHASLLPKRIEALCKFANESTNRETFIHPVVRAILIHFWIAYDHPFVDGNGRTARALFYWSMLRQGYWLTEFISISGAIKKARAQYDRAFLGTESDDNDVTYYILNQLAMLRHAVDDLSAYLQRKSREVRDVETRLRGRDDLNHRQLAILGHVMRHLDARITIESHRTSHRVVYETARTDLLGLVERGFLEQHKLGKKLYFTPVRDLPRKLT
jgi:Fic family protein